MANRKPRKYKYPGGVLGVPREVLRSEAYLDMPLPARNLMLHLQDVWKPHEPVIHYSVRRAAEILRVGIGTAAKAFNVLEEHGFIRMAEESVWNGGKSSKAREWHLSWLTSHGREPTNEWKYWNKLTTEFSQRYSKSQNCSASDTVSTKTPKRQIKNQQLRVISSA